MEREILFTGIGGQGIQLGAQVLARAAVAEGREVLLFGSYGGTMRGGPTDSTLVVADGPISAPPIVSRAWSALAMHPTYWAPVAAKLARDAVVVVNASLFEQPIEATIPSDLRSAVPSDLRSASPHCAPDGLPRCAPDGLLRVHAIPASRIASELGSSLAAAMVLVGAYAGLTGLVSLEALFAGLAASLPARRAQHREQNERALRAGFEHVPPGVAPAWTPEDRAA